LPNRTQIVCRLSWSKWSTTVPGHHSEQR